MSKLTAERLRSLLDYDPLTGLFTWKVQMSNAAPKVGQIAGWITSKGYVETKVDGKTYKAHRLAFLYMTGGFPENEVDHANRNRSDNRWKNLRAATRSQNMMNHTRKDNTSGRKGVYWHKLVGKWRACIMVNGEKHSLGFYNDIEDAAVAYKNIAMILHGDYNDFGA